MVLLSNFNNDIFYQHNRTIDLYVGNAGFQFKIMAQYPSWKNIYPPRAGAIGDIYGA